MPKTILIATEKPFAQKAIDSMKDIVERSQDYRLEMLEKYSDKSELINAVTGVDALIVRSDKVTAEVLDAATDLHLVVRAGAGFDNVDLNAATSRNIVVMNTPGQNSNAVAELVFGLMLNLARKKYTGKVGTELRNKKLGLQAYGNVGRCVAAIAQGFGMEIYAYDPYIANSIIAVDGVQVCESVEELYSTCDYISIHIPANKETIKSVNYNLLSKTKKEAALINTARKEVVDENGLMLWMAESQNFCYAADITPDCKNEMIEKFSDRVFFTTKKMGAQTAEANVNAATAAVTQIINFFESGDKNYQVNG